jgi:hypothetical protein
MNEAVQAVFQSYPLEIQNKFYVLRDLIFEVAKSLAQVGTIEETLKWNEPAYVTAETGAGSTIRLGWKKSAPTQYAMYFNCKTSLVEGFRMQFGDLFTYGGNRAIIFELDDAVPVEALRDCITQALCYHTH